MALLNKKDILQVRTLPYIDVEALGGTVRVQAMTASARDQWEQRHGKAVAKAGDGVVSNIRALFLVHCIVDETGALVFSLDDVEDLGKQPAADLDMLFEAAQEINGLTAEADEDVKKK